MKYFLTAAFICLFLSCSTDILEELEQSANANSDTATSSVSYIEDITPIITNSCLPCHGSGPRATAVSLDSHEELANYHSPSLLVRYLRDGYMPAQGSNLADSTIDKIETWFDDGAPNN